VCGYGRIPGPGGSPRQEVPPHSNATGTPHRRHSRAPDPGYHGDGRADAGGRAGELLRYGATVAAGCAAGAARHPDRTAIVDDAGWLSYAELHRRTDRLARALAGTGVGPGVRVGVLCRNHRGPVETQIAVSKLGADEEYVPAVQGCAVVTAWGSGSTTLEELIARDGTSSLPLLPPSGHTIVLTSGTTGPPRGARRPAPHSLAPVAAVLSAIPLRAGKPVLIAAPLLHTWGNAALLLSLLHGAPVVLTRRPDPGQLVRLVGEQRCDTVFAVPVMLQRLMDLDTGDAWRRHRPRVVAVSGSALPASLAVAFMDRFGDVLYNLYGSTEVS
jgi:acyl-CoA synthetase (AMP-forming)/AMP-acid ligase II